MNKIKEIYAIVVEKIKYVLDQVLDHEFVAGLICGFLIGLVL